MEGCKKMSESTEKNDTVFNITAFYNDLPFAMKLAIAAGVQIEYIFEDDKITVKTKNHVSIQYDKEKGWIVAERV